MIEQVIAHYRILRKLGAGGMGEVYLAEDTTLDRRVALKLLPPAHTGDAERLRRFKQEARAVSSLNHPSILTIYEVGEAGGHHFIATEFIDGETLRESLRRAGKMDPVRALNVAGQVASALTAAHEAGIVHRDVKPENIMARRDGYIKVLDFGLAKLAEPQPRAGDGSALTTTLAAHTAAGVVIGTAQYMSPEQANGATVDARSDIFSFGAVLYELLAGEPAFKGDSLTATLVALVNQEPPPLPESVPSELRQLVLRCLRKDPARRYQTMAEVRAALEDVREEFPRRPVQRKIPLRWTGSVAALILLIGAVLMWQPWRRPQSNEVLRPVSLTTLPGVERYPSLSPDGSQVVFTWTGDKQNNQDIYVQMIGQRSTLRLTTDPRNDYNPVWSPDGRWIAFLRSEPQAPTGLRRREVRLIPPLGGPDRKLADIQSQDFAGRLFSDAAYLAWSPDSAALIVTDSPGEGRPDGLVVVALDTGEKRPLTSPRPPVLADTSPAVSPDGRSLVFLRRTSWGAGELHHVLLGAGLAASGESRRLTGPELRADYPAWMPDSKEIVFSTSDGLWRVAVAGGSTPTRIPYVGEDGAMPAISRPQAGKPARLVYVRSFVDTNFWRIETSTPGAPSKSPPVQVGSSTQAEFHCSFSPDGRRIAFISARSGQPEVWIADPDGSNSVQLTSLRAPDTTWPHWSPDGQLIAFSSTAAGEFDIYVVRVSGGKPRRLTPHEAIDIQPAFSRDGKSIYFSSMRSGDFRIWKMPAEGGDAVQLTPNQGRAAAESADGYLYYHEVSLHAPLWRMPVAGGPPEKVLDGVGWFNFCLLDGGAYYMTRFGEETRLQYLDFTTRKSSTVASGLGNVSAGLTASNDGRTILFTRVDASVDDLMLVENFK
jgi:serine/threonine protein kinase